MVPSVLAERGLHAHAQVLQRTQPNAFNFSPAILKSPFFDSFAPGRRARVAATSFCTTSTVCNSNNFATITCQYYWIVKKYIYQMSLNVLRHKTCRVSDSRFSIFAPMPPNGFFWLKLDMLLIRRNCYCRMLYYAYIE